MKKEKRNYDGGRNAVKEGKKKKKSKQRKETDTKTGKRYWGET